MLFITSFGVLIPMNPGGAKVTIMVFFWIRLNANIGFLSPDDDDDDKVISDISND